MSDLIFGRKPEQVVDNEKMIARVAQEGRKVLEEDLPNDDLWIKASKEVYKLMKGSEFVGDNQSAAKAGLDMISDFNYNLGLGTLPQTIKLEDATPNQKASMLYLMDTYDKKDITMAGFGRAIKGVVQDPATYIGVGTLGAGLLAGQGTKEAAKIGIKSAIAKSMQAYFQSTAAVAATEGALYGTAQDVASQNVKVKAGTQKEISAKEAAASGAIGATIGAVAPSAIKAVGKGIGKGIDYIEKQGIEAMAQAAGGGTPTPHIDPDLAKHAGEIVKGISEPKPINVKSNAYQVAKGEDEYLKRQAIDMVDSDLSQYDDANTWHINFNTIQSKEDVSSIIAHMAEQNADARMSARGIKSDDMVRKMADEIGEDPESLIKAFTREDGFLPPAEYIVAARQFMEQSAMKLKESAIRVAGGDDSSIALAEFATQHALHNDFMNYFMGVRAEAGRVVRAFGIKFEKNQTDKINELIGRLGSGLDLRELAQQISMVDNVKGINNLAKAQKSLNKFVRDKFFAYYVSSLLSGVGTQFVNAIGGALNIGMSVADRALAARLGSKVESESERIIKGEAKAMMFAIMHSWRDSSKVGLQVLKSGKQYGGVSQVEAVEFADEPWSTRLKFQEGGFAQKAVDGIDTALQFPIKNVMGGTDAFFKVIAERASLAAVAFRRSSAEAERNGQEAGLNMLKQLTENPTPDMLEEAVDFAKYVTFQSTLGDTGQKIQRALFIEGIRWFAPFVKTPINIMKQGYLERTPASLLASQYKSDIAAGGAREQLARAKLYNGTMILSTAIALASNGYLTGTVDKDARYKGDVLAEEEPRSFVFTDENGNKKYISYDRLEPYSFLFGVAADFAKFHKDLDYAKITDEDDDKADRLRDAAILAIAENTTNKLYFQGVIKVMELITSKTKGEALERVEQDLVNGVIPYSGLRRNLTYIVDDKIKYSDDVESYVKANTPFLSNGLHPKLDVFGDEIDRRNPFPWTLKEGTKDKTKLEVQRITDAIRQAPIPSVNDRVKGTKLNGDEYYQLSKLARKDLILDGLNFHDAVSELIHSDDYGTMIDEDKVIAIRGIAHDYDNAAREIIAETNPKFEEKMNRLQSIKDMARENAAMGLNLDLEDGE